MIERDGLPAVIVCPAAPLGPSDVKPTPTGRLVAEAVRGGLPAYVETGLNVVHVDDVAAGHLAAMEHGAIGERYILGGENLSLCDLLTEISNVPGRALAGLRALSALRPPENVPHAHVLRRPQGQTRARL